MDIRPDIISHLKQDKQLAVLIDQCEIQFYKSPLSVYDDLIRSVVSQQLSTSQRPLYMEGLLHH